MLIGENGKFCARWSCNDETMRLRNRSILERPDRIVSVDDAFLDALRSDDAEVKWPSKDDLVDLGRRLDAWRLEQSADNVSCADVIFRISPPVTAAAKRRRVDIPPEMPWKLDVVLRKRTEETLRALGVACRIYSPLNSGESNCKFKQKFSVIV